jgi:hypothetical protein
MVNLLLKMNFAEVRLLISFLRLYSRTPSIRYFGQEAAVSIQTVGSAMMILFARNAMYPAKP